MKKRETVVAVHTHTHTIVLNKEKIAQKFCAKLRYEDGLTGLVCLFCIFNSS